MKRRAQSQISPHSLKENKVELTGSVMESPKCEEPESRPGVVMVYDRKINLHNVGDKPSFFELCRAWVQDDPDRPRACVARKHLPHTRSRSETDYDCVISYIHSILPKKTKKDGFTVDDINSLEGIAPRDILSLHIMHYKKSRKIRRTLALAKYGRLAALNSRRGDNFSLRELIDRLATVSKGDESLQELVASLSNRQNSTRDTQSIT